MIWGSLWPEVIAGLGPRGTQALAFCVDCPAPLAVGVAPDGIDRTTHVHYGDVPLCAGHARARAQAAGNIPAVTAPRTSTPAGTSPAKVSKPASDIPKTIRDGRPAAQQGALVLPLEGRARKGRG